MKHVTLLWCVLISTHKLARVRCQDDSISEDLMTVDPFEVGYSLRGDINIGILLAITLYNYTTDTCGRISDEAASLLTTAYQVCDVVNKNILAVQNVTMGYVILDACQLGTVAMKQATSFIPRTRCSAGGSGLPCNFSRRAKAEFDVRTPPYDMVALMGAPFFSQTLNVGRLLEAVQTPMITYSPSSYYANNPVFYPTAPSTACLFADMAKFLRAQNLTYVTVLHGDNAFGFCGLSAFKAQAKGSDICIAATISVRSRLNKGVLKGVEDVAAKLVADRKARVVVVILDSFTILYEVVKSTIRVVKKGHFIWVNQHAVLKHFPKESHLEVGLLGSFVVVPHNHEDNHENAHDHNCIDYNHPWLKAFREMLDQCHHHGICMPSKWTEYESHWVLASALSKVGKAIIEMLSNQECTQAVSGGSPKASCVTGPKLLRHLAKRNNERVDHCIVPAYNETNCTLIYQVIRAHYQDPETNATETAYMFDDVSMTGINWSYYDIDNGQSAPRSRCHQITDCAASEYLRQAESHCCMECTPCAEDEIPFTVKTNCTRCPDKQWPKYTDSGSSYCADATVFGVYSIHSTCLRSTGYQGVIFSMLVVAAVGLLACSSVLACFIYYRHNQIIKSSSIDMSCCMLVGIVLGYVSILMMLLEPSFYRCVVKYHLFFLSVSLVYGAMLLRAVRIYRIFQSGRKTKLRLIKTKSQIIAVSVNCFVQLLICLVCFVVNNSPHLWFGLKQSKSCLHMNCLIPITCLRSGYAYVALLATLCALLAFKTRFLPDEFKETRWMMSCVGTSFVIFVAMAPSYTQAEDDAFNKQLIPLLLLAVNHTFALIFLFVPKALSVFMGCGRNFVLPSSSTISTTRKSSPMLLDRHFSKRQSSPMLLDRHFSKRQSSPMLMARSSIMVKSSTPLTSVRSSTRSSLSRQGSPMVAFRSSPTT